MLLLYYNLLYHHHHQIEDSLRLKSPLTDDTHTDDRRN